MDNLLIITGGHGKGIAIISNKSDIAVENSPQGIVISHNALVSGRFNKGSLPEQKVKVENVKEITGSFSIVPIIGEWPTVLQKLFGTSSKVAKPFQPFYNSYDQ